MTAPKTMRDYRSGRNSEEQQALDDLFSVTYEELRRLASFVRRNAESPTLNSTALVHEVWLKLKDSLKLASTSLPHFKAIAAKAMRQVLVDEARRKSARKRGDGGASFVPLEDSMEGMVSCDRELLALDAALDELAQFSPRQAQVVENRFFGGFSVAETAALLDMSDSAVERDWRAAKAWLSSRIRPPAPETKME